MEHPTTLTLCAADSTDDYLVLTDPNGTTYHLPITEDLTLLATTATTKPAPAPEPDPTPEPEPAAEAEPEPTPRLTLPPREIQQRIRSGASIQDLATETGMRPHLIEPYAHPILAERTHMAELGQRSHPVRSDGPASITLAEILTGAFATRNINLADDPSPITWDAYRDDNRLWIITVTWTDPETAATHRAEWSYHRDSRTPTTVPRNPEARDLIDPNYGRPTTPTPDPLTSTDTPTSEDLLQHPEPTPTAHPATRRRKAITPHWEDVLLGVRPLTPRNTDNSPTEQED